MKFPTAADAFRGSCGPQGLWAEVLGSERWREVKEYRSSGGWLEVASWSTGTANALAFLSPSLVLFSTLEIETKFFLRMRLASIIIQIGSRL